MPSLVSFPDDLPSGAFVPDAYANVKLCIGGADLSGRNPAGRMWNAMVSWRGVSSS